MPHIDRHADASAEQNEFDDSLGGGIDEAAAENAADAMRQADLEAAQDEVDLTSLKESELASMSIDELRVVARQLDVPDRSKITEQDELIEAIKQRF